MATAFGLRPAERLTIFALLRGWNPRTSPAAIARVSLEELCAWTGLSKGQQSAVVRELCEGWSPALVTVKEEGSRGVGRLYGLGGLVSATVAVASGRVRRAERIDPAMRSAGRTDAFGGPNSPVRPAELKRSAGRTQSSVKRAQTLEGKKEKEAAAVVEDVEKRPLREVPDAELRHILLNARDGDARREAATAEWAARKQERMRATGEKH